MPYVKWQTSVPVNTERAINAMKTVISSQPLLTKGSTPRPVLTLPRRETRKPKKAVEGTLGSHRVITSWSSWLICFSNSHSQTWDFKHRIPPQHRRPRGSRNCVLTMRLSVLKAGQNPTGRHLAEQPKFQATPHIFTSENWVLKHVGKSSHPVGPSGNPLGKPTLQAPLTGRLLTELPCLTWLCTVNPLQNHCARRTVTNIEKRSQWNCSLKKNQTTKPYEILVL